MAAQIVRIFRFNSGFKSASPAIYPRHAKQQSSSRHKIKKPHEKMGPPATLFLAKSAGNLGAAGILAEGLHASRKAHHSGGTAADSNGLPPNCSAPAESQTGVYAGASIVSIKRFFALRHG
jgi:hypothetical protein